MSTARPGQVASRSTRPTPRCGSPTCRPASWCPARTRRASSRTRRRRCGCSGRGCWHRPRPTRTRRQRPSARPRSAPSTGPSGCAPTTSRRTASPITESATRRTTWIRSSTATWTRSSTPWRRRTWKRSWPSRSKGASLSLLLDEIALATARLAEAGVESPRADAELIAAHVHNVKRGELHTVPDSAFDATFWADIARRANREPLQHITGHAYFRYLELSVGPGVFVPRPETEVMTGWAIDRLRDMDVAEPVAVDLGTGSGAIALSIAQEVPRARVHAVEADPLARSWAERNITRYVDSYTAGRVLLHAGDFVTGQRAENGDVPADLHELASLAGSVDVVVSNPPYIPVGSVVPPEVGEYDPPAALWSGEDGMTAVRAVERVARRLLRPDGFVAVEHGAQQGAAVYWVFPEESGWRDTRNHKDLAGRDRFVTAVWERRNEQALRLPGSAGAGRGDRRR